MIREFFVGLGLAGAAILLYDAVHYPWSPYSLFSEHLFGNSVSNGGIILFVLLFFRLRILLFLLTAFYQAERWRYYLGDNETRVLWTDDLNPDAY